MMSPMMRAATVAAALSLVLAACSTAPPAAPAYTPTRQAVSAPIEVSKTGPIRARKEALVAT